jgi:ribonuclease HII
VAALPVGIAARVVRELDSLERRIRDAGFRFIAGADEAGRGALAGPMYAAAVILPEDFDIEGLRDSKQLTPLQRDEWFDRIRAAAVAVSVRRAFPRRIDHRGLHKSNVKLLRQAIRGLPVEPDFVIIDGFRLRRFDTPNLAIKKGDTVCASVAAASVVAKVTRDRCMERYHRRYPQYGFDQHRGYGTAGHRAAIAQFGPSPIHRLSFKGLTLYRDDPDLYKALYARSGPTPADDPRDPDGEWTRRPLDEGP